MSFKSRTKDILKLCVDNESLQEKDCNKDTHLEQSTTNFQVPALTPTSLTTADLTTPDVLVSYDLTELMPVSFEILNQDALNSSTTSNNCHSDANTSLSSVLQEIYVNENLLTSSDLTQNANQDEIDFVCHLDSDQVTSNVHSLDNIVENETDVDETTNNLAFKDNNVGLINNEDSAFITQADGGLSENINVEPRSCLNNVDGNVIPEVNENNSSNCRPKIGRKRKHANQNRELRKKLCIQNKDYYTQKNKLKERKEFRHYICPCKCLENIGEENAINEFKKFYSVESHDAQRALICSHVQEVEIKRKRVKTSDTRKFSRMYKLCGKTVCKSFYLQTLRISSCKVHSALKSMKRPEGVRDCRGKSGGKNKTDDIRIGEIINHIQKFPKYKSHYRRSNTEAEFLNEDTTVAKMYELYSEEVRDPVSLSLYKKVFLTKFNLRRKKLKKDTCNVCDRLQSEITHCVDNDKVLSLTKEKDVHLEKAEKAQNKRKNDMLTAKEQIDTETLCFDLEKTLPLPRIPTNIVYYKRQLCVYNLGIHSGKTNKGHCYVWIEGEAGRGAQEVGSCLRKHITENVTSKKLILWSDSCGGQNRNIKIVLILKAVLESHPTLEQITLRYLHPGHSFLPNDSDFGDIESSLKLQQRLYTVDDYIRIMEGCRKKNPLVVHRMKKVEFIGSQELEKQITNRKIDKQNSKVNWLQTREIEIKKENPLSIFFKTAFDEDNVSEIDISKKQGKGRPTNQPLQTFSQHLVQLWPQGKPISKLKLEDLKSLLPLIPVDAKSLYKSLFSQSNVEDDVEGFNGELDFQVEDE